MRKLTGGTKLLAGALLLYASSCTKDSQIPDIDPWHLLWRQPAHGRRQMTNKIGYTGFVARSSGSSSPSHDRPGLHQSAAWKGGWRSLCTFRWTEKEFGKSNISPNPASGGPRRKLLRSSRECEKINRSILRVMDNAVFSPRHELIEKEKRIFS